MESLNLSNLSLTLEDFLVGGVCTLGFTILDKQTPTAYHYGKRVGASVAGRLLQKSLDLKGIALTENTELAGKDMATGLIGSTIAAVEQKDAKTILMHGLRLKLSSMITREGMKKLNINNLQILPLQTE